MHAGPALQCGDESGETNEEATAEIADDLTVAWTIMEAVEIEEMAGQRYREREGREKGKVKTTW